MGLSITNAQRAEVVTQALPYIKKYNGKIVVVKYGGNAMINEQLKQQVMEDIALLWLILFLLCRGAPSAFYAKEGLVCVGFSWIVLSLLGCLPFYLSREIPKYVDALFEMVSGFTTTGSSIPTFITSFKYTAAKAIAGKVSRLQGSMEIPTFSCSWFCIEETGLLLVAMVLVPSLSIFLN